MTAKFHLLLDRCEYTSSDIFPLELMLKDFAISEGEKTFQKSSIDTIENTKDDTKEELWIQDNKYNNEDVTYIHWYNKNFYIIQTN